MERSTASCREHPTMKATAPPATTSNRSPEQLPAVRGTALVIGKGPFSKTD